MTGKAALVPKGPNAAPPPPRAEDFDRAALLAKLYAVPLPPHKGGRRPHADHTPLGRIMRLRGITVNEISAGAGCPNYRVLSDYLADRKPIPPHHRVALARFLKVDGRIF